MYKCCRWCNNFSDGKCNSESFIDNVELNLDKMYEEGAIKETLKEQINIESLGLEYFYKLAKELKISNVKARKLANEFSKILESLIGDVEVAVVTTLENNLVGVVKVGIKNEHEFVCSEFK
ncbi:hypothetical protein SAMN02910355_1885 [Terrisporobacter glycolicus]|nr:hypothetical protein SAMN02910355_1885 [Terrisporobacter glycolicus]